MVPRRLCGPLLAHCVDSRCAWSLTFSKDRDQALSSVPNLLHTVLHGPHKSRVVAVLALLLDNSLSRFEASLQGIELVFELSLVHGSLLVGSADLVVIAGCICEGVSKKLDGLEAKVRGRTHCGSPLKDFGMEGLDDSERILRRGIGWCDCVGVRGC